MREEAALPLCTYQNQFQVHSQGGMAEEPGEPEGGGCSAPLHLPEPVPVT